MHDRLVSRRIDALHQCFLVILLGAFIRIVCLVLFFSEKKKKKKKKSNCRLLQL